MNAQYGNNSAFEQLYQLNVGRVYALALRLTADLNSAYELTEKTFIEAWHKISTMGDDLSFASWLASLTINIYINEQQEILQKDVSLRHQHASDNKAELFIYDLPDQERVIFTLFQIEGYPVENISNLLSVSEDEIKTKLDEVNKNLKDSGLEQNLDSLPKKIEPEKDLWHNIFEIIHDIKVVQKKEEEELAAVEVVEETEEEKEERKKQEEELRKQRIEKRKEKIKEKFSAFIKEPKNRILFAVFVVIIISLILYPIISSSSSWEVLSVKGSPRLNGKEFGSVDKMGKGDLLTTSNSNSALVSIEGIGKIVVEPGSVIERLSGENHISLKKGTIIVTKINPEDYLFVEVPSADIRDFYLGGNYELTVDGNGNSTINLDDGWILIEDSDSKSYLLSDFSCRIEKGKGAGVPFNNKSTEIFKHSINDYIFNGGGSSDLMNILSQAGPEDAVSLWHLLRRVNENDRGKIINTLFALSPPPPGFNQEKLIKLDEDIMMEWLHIIRWRE